MEKDNHPRTNFVHKCGHESILFQFTRVIMQALIVSYQHDKHPGSEHKQDNFQTCCYQCGIENESSIASYEGVL